MGKKKSNKKKKKLNQVEQSVPRADIHDPVIVNIQQGDLNSVQNLLINVNFSTCKDWLEGYYLLLTAIEYNHCHIASWLISKGCRIDRIANDNLSDTPLHMAIYKNQYTIVKTLLEKGANKVAKNLKGETPLHISCKTVNFLITKLLLDHSIAADVSDVYLTTPLHIAVEKESLEIVQLLLNHNVNVNAYTIKTCYEGFTPLHIAVIKKNVEIIRVLLENEANINSPMLFDKNNNNLTEFPFMKFEGYTPLHLAVEMNDIEIIKLIVENQRNNIKINLQGLNIFHIAMEKESVEVIEFLLNLKININFHSNIDYCKGETLLHTAIGKQNIKLVELLLEKGADIDAPMKLIQTLFEFQQSSLNFNHEGFTPLHLAVEISNLDIIKLLLSYYPDIVKTDGKGFTPLHIAVEKECLEVVQVLLEYKKEMNLDHSKNYCRGLTPLHMAVIKNNLKLVETLLSNEADVNEFIGIWIINSPVDFSLIPYIKYKNYTALHVAVELNNHQMVIVLLNSGADVNAIIEDTGITPLHISIQNNNREIFYLLLQNNANFQIKTKEGKNILHLAVENDWPELVLEFIPRGINVNDQTINGETLLFIAVEMGEEDLVENLLRYNADVNIVNSQKESPLHVAAEFNIDIVKILLNNNAKIDLVNLNSETPLCISVKNNNPEIVAELLKFKPSIQDISNKYAFSYALKNWKNYLNIVNLLFEYGFEITAEDIKDPKIVTFSISEGYINLSEYLLQNFIQTEKNHLLVHNAVNCQDFQMIKFLIENKYDLNVMDHFGKLPIDYAMNNNDSVMINLLVKNGAKILNASSNFLSAAKMNNELLCKVLLRYGADVNVYDEYGTTALHFAVWHKNIKFVKFLLNNDALVNTTENCKNLEIDVKFDDEKINYFKNNNYTEEFKRRMLTSPLHIAITKGKKDICDTLIDFNANINSKDGHGRTTLHLAAAIKFTEQERVIKTLINCGADINVFDKSKKLPIHYAFNPICVCNVAFQNQYELYCECECNLGDDDHDKIIRFFVKYSVLLNCMNKCIHKDTLKLISRHSLSKNLQNACLSEINKMKEEKIGNYVTLYDILSEKSLSYARNKEITKVFESNLYEDKFPLYYEMLKENFNNLQSKERVMKCAIFSLNNLVSLKLPEDVGEKILQSLNLNNLNNLIEAGNLCKQKIYHNFLPERDKKRIKV